MKSKISWALILVGLLLPWILRVLVEIFYNSSEAMPILLQSPKLFLSPQNNFFLIGILNAAPFFFYGILLRSHMKYFQEKTYSPACVAVTVTGFKLLILSLLVHTMVWVDAFGPGEPSSRAVIGFVVFPVAALVVMTVVYAVSFVLARLIELLLMNKASDQNKK